MKVVDKVSPLLFDDCVTGNYLKKVDIIYDKPMGDDQQDYYKIHLEDALITSIQHSGSNENPMESISFAYSKIKVSYNPEEGWRAEGLHRQGLRCTQAEALVNGRASRQTVPSNPRELFKAGKVREAIQALTAHLRDRPSDTVSRTFLFELLCFSGEYTRAEKQLAVLASGSQDKETGAIVYYAALHAERTRHELFEKEDFPHDSPASPPGELNGKPFTELRDADPDIGARLEVFAAGSCVWLPFEHVESRGDGSSATAARYAVGSGACPGGSVLSRAWTWERC